MQEFDAFYKTYYRQVYLYLLDTFEGKCSIGTWMLQIAKNNFYNYCKKKKHISTEEPYKEVFWARVTFYRAKQKIFLALGIIIVAGF